MAAAQYGQPCLMYKVGLLTPCIRMGASFWRCVGHNASVVAAVPAARGIHVTPCPRYVVERMQRTRLPLQKSAGGTAENLTTRVPGRFRPHDESGHPSNRDGRFLPPTGAS